MGATKGAAQLARYVAVMPWWPHDASGEEACGIASIADLCRIPLVCALPAGCEPPQALSFSKVEAFEPFWFASQWNYSRLLNSALFYERFADFEYIVIVQSDVLLLRALDETVLSGFGWDYIGAAWAKQRNGGRVSLYAAGNGGFSMRRTEAFLRILRSPVRLTLRTPKLSAKWLAFLAIVNGFAALGRNIESLAQVAVSLKLHEDTFWARAAPTIYPEFTVCPPYEAPRFSVEREVAFAMQFAGPEGPIGAHGWKKHGQGHFDALVEREGYARAGAGKG